MLFCTQLCLLGKLCVVIVSQPGILFAAVASVGLHCLVAFGTNCWYPFETPFLDGVFNKDLGNHSFVFPSK